MLSGSLKYVYFQTCILLQFVREILYMMEKLHCEYILGC